MASAGPYANHLHLLQTDNSASTSSLNNFYRPDALPDAQPSVTSTEGKINVMMMMMIAESVVWPI